MRKLRVAIVGQGRSGYGIHGQFFASESNDIVEVVAAVDRLEQRRAFAAERHGCAVYADYRELFGRTDIDVVVNATMSMDHAAVTRDLLNHGFNVLVEKPFAKTEEECRALMALAEEKGKVLAVFQQSLFAPDFLQVKELIGEGKLGEIVEIAIHYAGFSRRWDWQTLQNHTAGSLYNTGPHPVGQALDLLGWDKKVSVAFSKLGCAITSGDAEDYAKVILTAPGKPLVHINLTATDAFGEPNFKIQGTCGTLMVKGKEWELKWLDPTVLPPRPVCSEPLAGEDGKPVYCKETLPWQTQSGTIEGTAFDKGSYRFYHMLADTVFEGKPLEIAPEFAARTIGVIEEVHRQNPLEVRF